MRLAFFLSCVLIHVSHTAAVQDPRFTTPEAFDASAELSETEAKIDEALDLLGSEVFLKLNWSSVADAVWMSPTNTPRLTCAGEVWLLAKASDLSSHDVEKALEMRVSPTMVLKRWCNFVPSGEFRIYASRNGKVSEIRQRRLDACFPELVNRALKISTIIVRFLESKILPEMERIDELSFDVYVDKKDRPFLVDVNVLELEIRSEQTTKVLLDNGVAFEYVASETDVESSERKAMTMNRVPLELVTGDLASLTTSGKASDVFEALEALARNEDDESE